MSSAMEAGEGNKEVNSDLFKSINHLSYESFIKLKVKDNYPDISDRQFSKAFNKIIVKPGFTTMDESFERFIYNCLLCDQLAHRPMVCSDCQHCYCRTCSSFLHVLFQAHSNIQLTTDINVKGFKLSNLQFFCLINSCGNNGVSKLKPLSNEKRNDLLKIKVNCIRFNCDLNGDYTMMDTHLNICSKGNNYRFDVRGIAETFLRTESNPVELDQESLLFCEALGSTVYNCSELEAIWKEKANNNFTSTGEDETISPHQSDSSSSNSSKRSSDSESTQVKKKLTPSEYLQKRKKQQIVNKIISSQDSEGTESSSSTIKIPEIKPSSWELLSNRIANLRNPIQPENEPENEPDIEKLINEDIERELNIDLSDFNESTSQIGKTAARRRRRQNAAARKRGDFSTVILPPKFIFNRPENDKGLDWNETNQNVTNTESKIDSSLTTTTIEVLPPCSSSKDTEPQPSTSKEPQPSTSSADANVKVVSDFVFSDPVKYKPNSIKPIRYTDDEIKLMRESSTKDRVKYRRRKASLVNKKLKDKRKKVYLEKLRKKSEPSKLNMIPPSNYIELITQNVQQLKKMNLNVCAIDIEKQTITMKDGSMRNVPVWISIVDQYNNLIYNSFVKNPISASHRFNAEFHGLSWNETQWAPTFYKVRMEVLEILRKYDRILLSGHIADFSDLYLSPLDHYRLLPRIIDLSQYYNCRTKKSATLGLKYSYLYSCSLKKIPDDSFISLTNLVELDLSNNYLDHIPVGALRETRSLRRLYLNLNAIKKIDSSAFVHLNSLQLLDLSNCAITSIQANSFEGLEKLNYLLLNGNKLKDLPGSILDSLVSLKQINLHENHWFCDCRIIDLRSGLIDRSISITVPPICDKPIRLKGSSWQNLGPDEFACSPKITSLTSAKFIKGSNGTITCRIHSTPMSNVSWYFESNQISRQIIKNSTYMSFGKQYVTIRDTLMDNGQTSKLTITETMEKDSGTYICYASNKAGNASNSIVIGVIQPEHSGEEELRSSDKDEQIGIILATILVFLLVILSVCFIFLRNKTSLFSSIFKTSNTENLAGEKIESNSTLDPSYHNCKPTLTNHIINKSIDNEQDRKRPFNQLTSKSSSTTSTIGAKDTIVITQSNGSLLTSDTLVKVFPPDQHSTTINDNNLSPNISNKSPDGSGFEKCLESYLMMSEDENSMLLPNRTNNSTIENQVDYNSIIQQQQESTDQQLTSLLSQEQLNHHLHHPQQQQQQAINWGQDVYDQSNIYSNRSLNRRYSDSSASLMVKQLNNNLIPVINSSRVTVHDDNSIELLTRSNNNNHPTTTATIDRFRPRRLSEGIITNRVNGLWNRNHHLISATINIHPNEDYSNWSIGQHNQQQQQHVVINNNDPDYLGKVNLIGSEKDSLLRRNGFANYDYSTLQSHRRCSKSGLSSLHNNNVVNNNSSAYLRALSLEDSSLSPTFPVIHESAKEYESELKN
ncbi:uncharacterized protein LOC128390376 [Panonychus citri]|uniref:uncharacterized protein LOC128390376 n=1 Tax=Panonychus citri TaxID=50023 RepID=UPI0023071FED|nr:uncharacterized protein LOC128390376 [Panonychus citri]